jgi:hypothetical protein
MKWLIETEAIVRRTYEVEADSEQEAASAIDIREASPLHEEEISERIVSAGATRKR